MYNKVSRRSYTMAKNKKREPRKFSTINQVVDAYFPTLELPRKHDDVKNDSNIGKQIASNLAEEFQKKISNN